MGASDTCNWCFYLLRSRPLPFSSAVPIMAPATGGIRAAATLDMWRNDFCVAQIGGRAFSADLGRGRDVSASKWKVSFARTHLCQSTVRVDSEAGLLHAKAPVVVKTKIRHSSSWWFHRRSESLFDMQRAEEWTENKLQTSWETAACICLYHRSMLKHTLHNLNQNLSLLPAFFFVLSGCSRYFWAEMARSPRTSQIYCLCGDVTLDPKWRSSPVSDPSAIWQGRWLKPELVHLLSYLD